MKQVKCALLALILLVSGCRSPGVGDRPIVVVDEDFGAHTLDVVDGVEGWPIAPTFRFATHADVIALSFEHVPHTEYMIATPHFTDCPVPEIPASAYTTVFDNDSAISCFDMTQIIGPNAPSNQMKREATHEFGHALGLPHLPEVSVMQSTYAGPDEPTAIDLEALR